ncbi:hypothetical protein KUG47_11900 [Falsochrobactrum sp. TDYN1]|uniref:Uncharacterized protein n=1 Tax=Falsochrobactrum tianjinense TaxID=2706015 RepID=A0A949UVE1_9HYPH|nr:hypothetical protein [Falsochrobactrum sp. TDYN1]MBV2144196.1 hypothetical protein [Falsochrobactrum sp. TDYN1]
MTKETSEYAAELPLDLESKALKLGENQLIGLHTVLGTMTTPEGKFDMRLHISGLCVWIQSPKGAWYQVNHGGLWEDAISKIIEHEKAVNPNGGSDAD